MSICRKSLTMGGLLTMGLLVAGCETPVDPLGESSRTLAVSTSIQVIAEEGTSPEAAKVKIEVQVASASEPRIANAIVKAGSPGRLALLTFDPGLDPLGLDAAYRGEIRGYSDVFELSIDRGSDFLRSVSAVAPHWFTMTTAPVDIVAGSKVTLRSTPALEEDVWTTLVIGTMGQAVFWPPDDSAKKTAFDVLVTVPGVWSILMARARYEPYPLAGLGEGGYASTLDISVQKTVELLVREKF